MNGAKPAVPGPGGKGGVWINLFWPLQKKCNFARPPGEKDNQKMPATGTTASEDRFLKGQFQNCKKYFYG